MVRFRHKTRKQPFRGLMQAIGLFQYGLAVVGLFLLLSPSFSSYVAGVFADTLAPAPRIPAVETRGRVVVNRGLP